MIPIPEFSLAPLGDSALVLAFAPRIDPELNDRVHAIATALLETLGSDRVECVPAYHTLTVHFDPMLDDFESLSQAIARLPASADVAQGIARDIVLPVCYDARLAPDLAAVAEHTGLDVEALVHLHSTADYRVYFLGFKPGFAYLGGLPDVLHMPRKESPRLNPGPSPGGWQLIGRTPICLFDLQQAPPSYLQPGDRLRIQRIGFEEFIAMGGTP
jgi:inhibitor of KinA